MRRRYTGCGCTVVSHGHRRNNIAFQQTVAPVIAYRDAAEIIPTQPSAPKIPTLRYAGAKTYATMDVLPPGPTPMTVQATASI